MIFRAVALSLSLMLVGAPVQLIAATGPVTQLARVDDAAQSGDNKAAKKERKKKPKKVCRRQRETGSRIAKRVCRSEEEWARQDELTRDSVDRTFEESRRNTATVSSQ